MHPSAARRYEPLRTIRQHGDRCVIEAHDRLRDRRVILKSERPHLALQELRTLLAIPPRVGPEVTDVIWHPDQGITFVLEHLAGKTLLETSPQIEHRRIPALVRETAQVLAHLHRAGFVHADLKPSNVFMMVNQVRLIDFGFAFGRAGSNLDDTGRPVRGGTPPFLAPEIRRGWVVDGRADQFSLGMTLRKLFPDLEHDARWQPVLERLCEESPSRRYAHTMELRDELKERFGLSDSPDRIPVFGGGPLRGREDELRRVVQSILNHPVACILLTARPGIGLSRFMLEVAHAVASAGGPALRLIDFGSLGWEVDPERVSALVDESRAVGDATLLGVPDPSPGFHGCPRATGNWLKRLVRRAEWEHLMLDPLGSAALVELVAESLGLGGDLAGQSVSRLQEETDGDLRCSAKGLHACLEKCGCEEGLSWEITSQPADGKQDSWSLPTPGPSWSGVAAHLAPALALCARAGRSMPREIAAALLAEFARPNDLAGLLDHGYLIPGPGERLHFLTGHLHTQAVAQPCLTDDRIEAWLDARLDPDIANVTEVLAACRRARKLGRADREARHLGRALERALEERRYEDALRLFAHPNPPPATWTMPAVEAQAAKQARLLGSSWTHERLLLVAGRSLALVQRTLSNEILELVAESGTSEPAIQAQLQLLEVAASGNDPQAYQARLVAVIRSECNGARVEPGVVNTYRAAQAFALGDIAKAEELAQKAARDLSGSGLRQAGQNQQLLAILKYHREPQEAIALMTRAAEQAPHAAGEVHIRINLSIMHYRQGQLEAAADCADRGMQRLEGRMSAEGRAGLRVMRLAAWAALGHTDMALREAADLLSTSAVRRIRSYLGVVWQILGECRLQRFSSPAAFADLARSLQVARAMPSAEIIEASARVLLDALLDVDAGEDVRRWLDLAELDPAQKDAPTQTTLARSRALRCQLDGKLDKAAEFLEAKLNEARQLQEIVPAARFLHHLGLVRRAQAESEGSRSGARAAARHFADELGLLREPGYGYYRAAALMERARALRLADEPDVAAEMLDQAVRVARDAECLGLLATALRERAHTGLARESQA